MKRMISVLLAAFLLSGCESSSPELCRNSPVPIDCAGHETAAPVEQTSEDSVCDIPYYEPLNFEEQRAVWISYIDMADLIAETEEGFRENISQAFDSIKAFGLNTVYAHIRAFGDAYYISDCYVPAKALPAEDGTFRYDPLKIMTELAHERGLSIHAWINPMRCDTAENMERMQGTELYEWYAEQDIYPEYLTSPDGTDLYWLNPALPEVRGLITDGVREICEGYDIDGIHIDDYFYPTTDKDFDDETYAAADTELSLSDWRLGNCTLLVKEIHDAVKETDEDILFGVSPQGNIDNNYTKMYADVKRWCTVGGYIDYIAPQIYFGYDNTVCPFFETMTEWRDVCRNPEVRLVCGLAMYKTADDAEFSSDGVIARQITDCKVAGYDGFALYSFASLFEAADERSVSQREAILKQISK